jgi:replicative DNA helicase
LQIFPTGAQAFSGIKDKIDYLVAAFEGVKDRTGAAVLVISQKNRAGYYGKGLETLMGSAQIEYTADAVLLLDSKQEQEAREHRKGGTEKSELDEMMDYAGPEEAIELIIAKQRYNKPARLPLAFDGRYSEFSER